MAETGLEPCPCDFGRCGLLCGTRTLVSHLDGFAEMCNRLLKGGTAQRLVAGLAPPFDRRINQTSLREMMRQHFGLSRRLVVEAIAQSLRYAAMQDLAPALQEILIGRVLNERVLEAIVAFGQYAFHQHDVGVGKLFQRRFERRIVHAGRECPAAARAKGRSQQDQS
jgi:hypothetical protein